jgi:hypothetical protein
MAKSPSTAAMDAEAQFVFQGTVKKTGAATPGLSVSDKSNLAVVHVEAIERSPEVLQDIAGQDITVRLADGEEVKKGDKLTFYTNGWMFGQTIGVQSLGHARAKATRAAAAAVTAAGHPAPALSAHKDNAIRKRVQDARLVVSGKVVAVGEPSAPVALTANSPAHTGPISEHAPFWREAVVEVSKVHKGRPATRRVVVRFPASTDVRWHRAPKFKVGDEGVFVLHDDKVSGDRAALGAGPTASALAAAADNFTCLDQSDFEPAHNAAEVASAIRAAEG